MSSEVKAYFIGKTTEVSITISLKNIHGIWKLRLLKMKRKKKAVSI